MSFFANKLLYKIALIIFSIYVVNTLFGKISTYYTDNGLPIHLEDWLAALLLFSSVVCFTLGVFRYEKLTDV